MKRIIITLLTLPLILPLAVLLIVKKSVGAALAFAALLVLPLAAAAALFVSCEPNSGGRYEVFESEGEYGSRIDETFSGVTSLDIDGIFLDVKISPNNSADTYVYAVVEHGGCGDNLELKYEQSGGKLSVFMKNRDKKPWRNIRNVEGYIEIKLGSDVTKLDVGTVSGDVDIKSVRLGDADMESISGDIALENISADKLDLNTISGDADIKNSIIKTIYGNTVSGDIKATDSTIDAISCNSISGDIDVYGGKVGKVHSSSISGDVVVHDIDGKK